MKQIPGLIPPTAGNLSENETYERMEMLRALGPSRHGAPATGIARDPRIELDKKASRQPEFHNFARDWNAYMRREQ